MLYKFQCDKCEKEIVVKQPMDSEHRANCPDCGSEARRLYPRLEWIWGGSVYRPDGSRRQDSDYNILKG